MSIKNKTKQRDSVAILGMSATAPVLYDCGDGVFELDVCGETYSFKAKDTNEAVVMACNGDYRNKRKESICPQK